MISFHTFHTMFDQMQSMADTLQEDIERTLNRKFDLFQVEKSKLIKKSLENPSISMKIKIEDEGHICIKNDQIKADGDCRVHIEEYCAGTHAIMTGEHESFNRALGVKPVRFQKQRDQEGIRSEGQQEKARQEPAVSERVREVPRGVERQLGEQSITPEEETIEKVNKEGGKQGGQETKTVEGQGPEGKTEDNQNEESEIQEKFQDVGHEQEKGREISGTTEKVGESIREVQENSRKQEGSEDQTSEKEMIKGFRTQENLRSDEEKAQKQPEISERAGKLPKEFEWQSEEQTNSTEEGRTEDKSDQKERIEGSSSQESQEQRQQKEKETKESTLLEKAQEVPQKSEMQSEEPTKNLEEERIEDKLSEQETIEKSDIQEEHQEQRQQEKKETNDTTSSERIGMKSTGAQTQSGEQTKDVEEKTTEDEPSEKEKNEEFEGQEQPQEQKQQQRQEDQEPTLSKRTKLGRGIGIQQEEYTKNSEEQRTESRPSEKEKVEESNDEEEPQEQRQQQEKERQEPEISERASELPKEFERQSEEQTKNAEEERTDGKLNEEDWVEQFNIQERLRKERLPKLSERTGVITEFQRKSRTKPSEMKRIKASRDQEERQGESEQQKKEEKETGLSERTEIKNRGVEGQSGEQTQDATIGGVGTKPSEQETIHAG